MLLSTKNQTIYRRNKSLLTSLLAPLKNPMKSQLHPGHTRAWGHLLDKAFSSCTQSVELPQGHENMISINHLPISWQVFFQKFWTPKVFHFTIRVEAPSQTPGRSKDMDCYDLKQPATSPDFSCVFNCKSKAYRTRISIRLVCPQDEKTHAASSLSGII